MAFKLNSTPTKVAAWISALIPVHIFAHSSLLRQGRLSKRENGNTHISRESPSHSWSETFPESSDSIRSDQFSSTIEETGVCPLRGGLKSGFDSLLISHYSVSPLNLVIPSPLFRSHARGSSISSAILYHSHPRMLMFCSESHSIIDYLLIPSN
jgi:hypothetical protein